MRLAATAVFLGIAASCAHSESGGPASPPPALARAAQDLVRAADARSQSGGFSGVVLLAYRGQPLAERAYGLADRDSGTPITTGSRFVTASVTQTFTAVAVMQRIAAGELTPETTLGTVRPELTSAELKGVTVGQLLTHTAGVQGGVRSPAFQKDPARFTRFDDYLQLAATEPLKAGGAFSDSDGGYALLGAMVQRVSGEPFETYLQAHVFQPAGMQNTVFRLRPPPSQLARGYTARGGGPASPNDPLLPTVASPGAGAASTAEDLLKFAEALRTHRLLDRGATADLLKGRVSTGRDAPNDRYGYGFFDGRVGTLHVIQHGGTGPGIDVCFDLYPDLEGTLIILSNRDAPAAQELRDIVRADLGGKPGA